MNTSQYALLKTKLLNDKAPFVNTRPEWTPALIEDPAMSVMTDFTRQPPYTTNENVQIQTALQQMKMSKVRSLFVVDKEDLILGHISARDIQSPKAAMIAGQQGIKPFEVTVKMLMAPLSEMNTLQFNELSNARVGHITRLFHDLGTNYIFVLETDDQGNQSMRGMFSISRVSQQLGENMMGDLSSHSVAEMTHLI